jgi:RNA polymerase sigma factor (sigma-70 family)
VRIPEILAPIEKEELINRIIAENNRQLLSIAREYAAPPDEVMDLYQDFVYELWESLDRFEGRSSPWTWACAIALNKAHAFVRNKPFRQKDEKSKVWLPFKEFLQNEYHHMNHLIRLDQGAAVLLCVGAASVGMYAVPFLSAGLQFACWAVIAAAIVIIQLYDQRKEI